jgi:hypothetical protein
LYRTVIEQITLDGETRATNVANDPAETGDVTEVILTLASAAVGVAASAAITNGTTRRRMMFLLSAFTRAAFPLLARDDAFLHLADRIHLDAEVLDRRVQVV